MLHVAGWAHNKSNLVVNKSIWGDIKPYWNTFSWCISSCAVSKAERLIWSLWCLCTCCLACLCKFFQYLNFIGFQKFWNQNVLFWATLIFAPSHHPTTTTTGLAFLQIWLDIFSDPLHLFISIFTRSSPLHILSSLTLFYWCLFRVALVVSFHFLPQNFGKVVGTYEWHLLFCECRWSDGSTWDISTQVQRWRGCEGWWKGCRGWWAGCNRTKGDFSPLCALHIP